MQEGLDETVEYITNKFQSAVKATPENHTNKTSNDKRDKRR